MAIRQSKLSVGQVLSRLNTYTLRPGGMNNVMRYKVMQPIYHYFQQQVYPTRCFTFGLTRSVIPAKKKESLIRLGLYGPHMNLKTV